MRTLMLSLVLAASFATPTFAEEPSLRACLSPLCGGIDAQLMDAFAAEGLTSIDGIAFQQDERGNGWLTIVSVDARGLDKIGPRSGARTEPIPGTISFARTVPLELFGMDTVKVPGGPLEGFDGFLKLDGVDGEAGGGGGGGGGSDCEEVCVCTEEGPECWYEC